MSAENKCRLLYIISCSCAKRQKVSNPLEKLNGHLKFELDTTEISSRDNHFVDHVIGKIERCGLNFNSQHVGLKNKYSLSCAQILFFLRVEIRSSQVQFYKKNVFAA